MSELLEAAQSGDRRRLLEEMRDVLAKEMATAPGMVIAQIAARLQAVAKELDELPLGTEVSVSDELAARRKARRTKAKSVRRAAGGSK